MIKFVYYVYFGIKDAFSHKLRAILSILGVVFGVAAVIAMVSISEGAKMDVMRQIRMLGIDNISIIAKRSDGADAQAALSPLLYKDYSAVKKLEFIKSAAPLKIDNTSVNYKAKTIQSELFGINEDYKDILMLPIENGRFFIKEDMTAIKNVCVIGASVKNSLFGLKKALGEVIKVNNDWYKVVGVIKERLKVEEVGAISFKNIDGAVMVPISTFFKTYFTLFEKPISEIAITIKAGYDKKDALRKIEKLLKRDDNNKGFDIIIPSELIAQSYKTKRVFNIVLGVIAAISLVVGGIGIMNIMLANVTERTREIGIRRAIGAKKTDIMIQFILESLVLTFLGGAIGILLGIVAASFINYKIGWTVYISPTGVLFALLTASLTGMIFGIYPAIKAALKNPIESLKYE